jgi:hypothetical protein
MRKDKDQYQSTITLDSNLVCGRVPSPLLQGMNARPGDRLTFHRVDSTSATMRLSRAKKKPSKKRR